LNKLHTLSGDSGAKTLLNGLDVAETEIQDPGIFLDADTPDALEILKT
jgi:CTP:molybdopterin cytidylyltransferase MocA